MNINYGKLVDGNLAYAPDEVRVDGMRTINPTAEHYLAAEDGPWKAVSTAQPAEPAPTGYHYEADGWDETDTTITRKWKTVEDAKVYRKFSKLKIYQQVCALENKTNSATTWEAVTTWLRGKTIQGMNGLDAFNFAQEISEDHPLFAAWAEEARVLLELSTEQFETLLAACILED